MPRSHQWFVLGVAAEPFTKIYSTGDLAKLDVTCRRSLRRLVGPPGNVQRDYRDLHWHHMLHEWNAGCTNIKTKSPRLGTRFVCNNFRHLLPTFVAYFLNAGSLDYWLGTPTTQLRTLVNRNFFNLCCVRAGTTGSFRQSTNSHEWV